ncbi:MAG: LamG domain-containing protein, partial [bacterium]|nr:LamG domain-containing protein [bacterium]
MLCLLLVMGAATSHAAANPYVVTWTTPSDGPSGSMPLGNGDIGVNAWVEADGDLVFYVSKTDAWSGNGRLLKVGRVRVALSPNPFVAGQPFEQTLDTRTGMMTVTAGPPDAAVTVRLWVDANYPAIRVEMQSLKPTDMRVALEMWRTEPRELVEDERHSAYGLIQSPDPVIVQPDTVVEGQTDRVVWYHRNEKSIWTDTLRQQGMGDWTGQGKDPLLHRTFGGLIQGPGLVSDSADALKSSQPATRHAFAVYVVTEQTDQPAQWVEQVASLAGADTLPAAEALANHTAWWDDFCNRSWIRVSGGSSAPFISANDLPLRIGADSDGRNQFRGAIERVQVFDEALAPEAIAKLAAEGAAPASRVGDWVFAKSAVDGSAIRSALEDGLPARIVGDLPVTDAAEFGRGGWIEIDDAPELDLARACTLAGWIVPGKLPSGGGRIIDKSQAGTSNGYLLDTFPGNSLRFICDAGTFRHDAKLAPGKRTHVAASFDAKSGEACLYVNGKRVARHSSGNDVEAVSRGYALQRYISACAGRGGSPIKFNGTIFTVDAEVKGQQFDADYRRWGGPYWNQNTRLAYWPMLAAGDTEMMRPWFRMYADMLPFAKARTRTYFDCDGAFFPETM